MNNEPTPANGASTPQSAPVSASALVGGADPRSVPSQGWQAPLTMAWKKGDEADRPLKELGIAWGPVSQSLSVGREVFVHDGPPTTLGSSGVARLLLAAAAPRAVWRPVGEPDELRLAEFNAAIVEMLLDMVLMWSTEGMPVEMIAPQIAQASNWLVSAPSMMPFPSSARDAVAKLLGDLDAETLARLSPIFFERRKIDRRGFDPAAIVSFKFSSDQVFEGPTELQSQLKTQLGQLHAMAAGPRSESDLTVDELVLRAYGQPNQQIATAARDEMIARLRRMEAMGEQASSASMMESLRQMMDLVVNVYYLVRPVCRVCGMPGTHFLPLADQQRDYRCDNHPIPPPASESAREVSGAATLRAAAFIARQVTQMAPMAAPSAPAAHGPMEPR
jgi:hypothetical protein